jgi:hypothetical protein
VAVAQNSTIAATSPDGITWTQQVLPVLSTWQAVTYGNGVFVTVAQSSTIAATFTPNQRTISIVNTPTAPVKSVPGTNTASVTVSVPGITADSSISAFLVSDTTTDHNAYEHEVLDMKLSCDTIVPGVSFTINGYSDKRLEGDFKVRYAWGTP